MQHPIADEKSCFFDGVDVKPPPWSKHSIFGALRRVWRAIGLVHNGPYMDFAGRATSRGNGVYGSVFFNTKH